MNIECEIRTHNGTTQDGTTQPTLFAGEFNGALHGMNGCWIFTPYIYVSGVSTNGKARNQHSLKKGEGISLHQHSVSEGAAIAFVGVDHNVFMCCAAQWGSRMGSGNSIGHGFPFNAGGKTRPASASKSRFGDLLNCRGRSCRHCRLQAT